MLFEALKDLLTDVNMTFDSTGMRLLAMDGYVFSACRRLQLLTHTSPQRTRCAGSYQAVCLRRRGVCVHANVRYRGEHGSALQVAEDDQQQRYDFV